MENNTFTISGYSPNDFIWKSLDTPTDDCSGALVSSTYPDGKLNASINAENCNNKLLSVQILAKQTLHSGAGGRYTDTVSDYNTKLLTCVNLGVGIIGVGFFIYYNQ